MKNKLTVIMSSNKTNPFYNMIPLKCKFIKNTKEIHGVLVMFKTFQLLHDIH